MEYSGVLLIALTPFCALTEEDGAVAEFCQRDILRAILDAEAPGRDDIVSDAKGPGTGGGGGGGVLGLTLRLELRTWDDTPPFQLQTMTISTHAHNFTPIISPTRNKMCAHQATYAQQTLPLLVGDRKKKKQ